MGAWIEIRCNPYPYTPLDVAPLVGAWIEIAALVSFWKFLDRRSSRGRSEEHTSELQSRENLVCRLLLEKKKKETKDN